MSADSLITMAIAIIIGQITAMLVEFLRSRKIPAQSSHYTDAAKFHTLVSELHTGSRDKYTFMLRLSIVATATLTTSIVSLVGVTVIVSLRQQPDPPGSFDIGLLADVSYLLTILVFSIGFASYTIQRLRDVMNSLDDFASYDAAFKDRWRDVLNRSSGG